MENSKIKKLLWIPVCLALAGVGGSLYAYHIHQPSMPATHASSWRVRRKINNQIKHMSYRQKIGQMFVGSSDYNNANYNAKVAHHYNLGGILLDGNNMTGNVKYRNYRMQKVNHHSLLIGTDQEGGLISRLGYNPRRYPSPKEAYHQGGMHREYTAYHYSAKQLHRLGINWNYAPDVDNSKRGSYMYYRSFAPDSYKDARYARTVVPAIQSAHVASTLKHFPGYGSASQDTDFHVVRSNRSLYHLKHYDFPPFKAGIHAGADSVMVTNIILNKIQRNVPATLSKRDINLLRHGLHFNGVIVTDSLDAVAVRDYARSHHVSADYQAIKAGNDMIMSSDFRRAIPRLTYDVKRGWISKKQINQSVYRILMMKYKLGLNY